MNILQRISEADMELSIKEAVKHFKVEGSFIYGEPYGCGHINDTYAVYFKRENEPPVRYILQRINTSIFDADMLMNNISLVTNRIKDAVIQEGGDPERNTLTIIPTLGESLYYKDPEGNAWRMYIFIENTVTYQSAATEEVLYHAGKAFGHFQKQLSGFEAKDLKEVIPNFHNTPHRFDDFCRAVRENRAGRAESIRAEIEFVNKRKQYCDRIISVLGTREMPLRVTHNDTKLNNILMNPKTGESVCIIDLDTVMPGSLLYDFGDSNRFGSNTAVEDETDLSKVHFSLDMFRAYTEGFLSETKEIMTGTELDLMAFSCILETYEVGMRFLTDYLNGDHYFKISHPEHNLERARNQFKLIEDMEAKQKQMQQIVAEICNMRICA
jgi:hypothetical protein